MADSGHVTPSSPLIGPGGGVRVVHTLRDGVLPAQGVRTHREVIFYKCLFSSVICTSKDLHSTHCTSAHNTLSTQSDLYSVVEAAPAAPRNPTYPPVPGLQARSSSSRNHPVYILHCRTRYHHNYHYYNHYNYNHYNYNNHNNNHYNHTRRRLP